MIRLLDVPLPARAKAQLQEWQDQVDSAVGFPASIALAKKMFGQKNTAKNATFKQVKAALGRMQGPLLRCAYCEDSVANEVEHIFPKDIYPDRVFAWTNYTYACGPCNGPKRN